MYLEGDFIVHAGDPSAALYFIKRGECSVTIIERPNPHPHPTLTLTPHTSPNSPSPLPITLSCDLIIMNLALPLTLP